MVRAPVLGPVRAVGVRIAVTGTAKSSSWLLDHLELEWPSATLAAGDEMPAGTLKLTGRGGGGGKADIAVYSHKGWLHPEDGSVDVPKLLSPTEYTVKWVQPSACVTLLWVFSWG